MKNAFLLLLTLSFFTGALRAQAPAGSGNVTPEAAAKLLAANPKIIVLDVRTAEEFGRGHIAGAVNISAADPDFDRKVATLDVKSPLLVHCASGGRSGRVLPTLEKLSFPAIYHLNGGFNGWQQAGQSVVK